MLMPYAPSSLVLSGAKIHEDQQTSELLRENKLLSERLKESVTLATTPEQKEAKSTKVYK